MAEAEVGCRTESSSSYLAMSPDIICLTECDRDFLADDGHCINATADYGYPSPPVASPAWRV